MTRAQAEHRAAIVSGMMSEIRKVIWRYTVENDLHSAEVIGALVMVQHDMWDRIPRDGEEDREWQT